MTTSDVWQDLAPPNIEAITAYEPGKPVEELERELGITGAIKLASNENPLGPSPLGVQAAQRALGEVNRYPDGGGFRLRRALGENLGVPVEEIMLGGGSNDLIDVLIRAFCRPGVDEVLTHRYAFFMYKVSAQAAGVVLREAPATPELACDVDALADAITPATKLIFLPNPNNPTGSYVGRAAFERFLERVPPRILLVVDEAYHEYASVLPDYPSAVRYRGPERPLLVSLRTFSKIYGLAGLRVGYGVADQRVINYVNRVRLPFNTASVAQEAAIAALGDTDHVQRSRRANAEGLSQLTDGLGRLGLHVYASAANFVLVDTGRDSREVYDALLRRGVIVRPVRPSGLLTHLRVSIGSRAENARAIGAFAEVLGANGPKA
jgi:histidinol-phosphate aminotransferase